MFQIRLRPGQGFQRFNVLSNEGGVSGNGRTQSHFSPKGEIIGMLTVASHGELEQWRGRELNKQEAHPVLYKIIQKGAENRAKPTDILMLGDRKFTVKGVHNPAGLNHFTVYFAEERKDLQ